LDSPELVHFFCFVFVYFTIPYVMTALPSQPPASSFRSVQYPTYMRAYLVHHNTTLTLSSPALGLNWQMAARSDA
jgi:hypothetical protein